MRYLIFSTLLSILLFSCSKDSQKLQDSIKSNQYAKKNITESTRADIVDAMIEKFGKDHSQRIEKGVNHSADIWEESHGTADEFKEFCLKNFIADDIELENELNSLQNHFESINGYFNQMTLDLKEKLHLLRGDISEFDNKFGAYDPSSHFKQDMINNKTAILINLNFPFYTLEEKDRLGMKMNEKAWAKVRAGDLFTENIPANLLLEFSEINTKSSQYIAEYNIYMGNLTNESGEQFFPDDMKLISHWNLRDELKSQYSNTVNGTTNQEIIYNVMLKIIDQSIPQEVINSDKYKWDPIVNTLYDNNNIIEFNPENNTRYKHLLDNFKIMQKIDAYSAKFPSYIERKFDKEMEMPQAQVEELFVEYLSNPLLAEIGQYISKRLGRQLRPYDIWYDGFKPNNTISESQLNKLTKEKYPDTQALENDLPRILKELDFSEADAEYIASKIAVDPARGAGHAWGAQMKGAKARLRSRFGEDGLDYKGYNIAIHELGHNVEQTITLYDVENYFMNGVPNNAFTEAIAFMFQQRDLELLGLEMQDREKQHYYALENCWSTAEIMGVAIVDMRVWKWMYSSPKATPKELKDNVIRISKEVWNEFFSPIFGVEDSPILAIYSHMISYPLYLAAYPVGHLIEFQLESEFKGKNFSNELRRVLEQGRMTPNVWMQRAVGEKISTKPTIEAAHKALIYLQEGELNLTKR